MGWPMPEVEAQDCMAQALSVKNDRVKRLKQLTTRRGRRKANRYLLLGKKIIADACQNPLLRPRIKEIYKTQQCEFESETNVSVYELAIRDFSTLLGPDFGYDIVAVVTYPDAASELPTAILDKSQPCGLCVTCGVQDPGNLGTIFRTSWFLGLHGLVMTEGTTDPWSPKVQRAAIGALLRIPIKSVTDSQAALEFCKSHEITPVLLQTRGGLCPTKVKWPARVAFFLGEEGQGFNRQDWSPESVGAIDITIQSPEPAAESLNVAVAYSIVSHAWSNSMLTR